MKRSIFSSGLVFLLFWVVGGGVMRVQGSSIEVLRPRKGEKVKWGCYKGVTWEAGSNVKYVFIDYSLDNGGTWRRITKYGKPSGEIFNDGYSFWNPPWVWRKNALIRITNAANPNDYTISEKFTIMDANPKFITLTHPGAGDSFVGGTALEIVWESSRYAGDLCEYDDFYYIRVEFSDNGGQDWRVIRDQTENDGSLMWYIPADLNSADCLIRVSHTEDHFPVSSTSGLFEIQPPAEGTHFVEVSSSAGIDLSGIYRCASWVDLDEDGFLDLFVTGGVGYSNVLYLNNGNGTFSRASLQAEVENVEGYSLAGVFGDVDNDGFPDLYLGGGDAYDDKLFLNAGDGTFVDVTSQAGIESHLAETNGVAFLDYDLDGDLDIYVTKWEASNLLYRNNGDSTFTDVSAFAGVDGSSASLSSTVAVGDYDNDGDPDLYVVNSDRNSNILYQNNGNGTFSDVTSWERVKLQNNSKGAEWGEFNNERLLDLYVSRRNDSNVLYQQNRYGRFEDVTEWAQVGDEGEGVVMTLGDFDSDGYLDICVANQGFEGENKVLLYMNNREAEFNDLGGIFSASALLEPRGMALGDYDGDGDLDLFVTNCTGPCRLFENRMTDGNGNRWLKTRLVGVESNRDGIGSRVGVFAGGMWQTREVQVGTGFGNTNSLEVEFGLGDEEMVDSLVVFWPSGIVQSFADLAANDVYVIEEVPGGWYEGSLAISCPAAEEVFRAGRTEEIVWQSTGEIETVLLECSTDDGATWTPVQTTENDGLFDWEIPEDIFSDSCYVRISDADDGEPSATSARFVVESPTIPVQWAVGDTVQQAGVPFWVTLDVGDGNRRVHNLLGMMATVSISPPEFVDVISDSIRSGSMWGGDPVVDVYADTLQGKIYLEIVRDESGGGFSGFGQAFQCQVEARITVPDTAEIQIGWDDLTLVNSEGDTIPSAAGGLTLTIFNRNFTVWPGDANNDGIVNQEDVLPVGFYWGLDGPAREGGSTTWTGQRCTPWTVGAAVYSDGTGDGVVNIGDVDPILANWGQSHEGAASTLPVGSKPSDASIRVQVEEHDPSEPFCANLVVSEGAALFGVALGFTYYADKVEVDSVKQGGLWDEDVVFVSRDDPSAGKVGIGISRKAGQTDGTETGILVRVWMRLKSEVAPNTPIVFRLVDVEAMDALGEGLVVSTEDGGFVTTDVADGLMEGPSVFRLYSNYPNPFNPTTVIAYDLPRDVRVTLRVYDTLGREVRTLVDERQTQGRYSVSWDGRDDRGMGVSSGLYFYRIVAGKNVFTKKCVLTK